MMSLAVSNHDQVRPLLSEIQPHYNVWDVLIAKVLLFIQKFQPSPILHLAAHSKPARDGFDQGRVYIYS